MATVKQKARNQRVIERLEKYLKDGHVHGAPLTDKDITRINKELEVLKTRI